MSQEKVLKTLEDLGFTQSDARVYIFLSKRGPQKGSVIAKFLKIPRQTLYFTITNLQKKGLVTASLQRPAKFSVVPFDKVLDMFVKAKLEEAQRMQINKNELLSDWQSIALPETEETSAKFTVIEGRNNIYSKIQQMLEETERKVDFITNVTGLLRADEFGLFDATLSLATKIKVRFLTEISEKNISNLKILYNKKLNSRLNIEGRIPDLGSNLFPSMVIRDDAEVLFLITSKEDSSVPIQDNLCLWTNCKSLVQAFRGIFEELWDNSTDIQKKIVEIETGEPSPKTCIIKDMNNARKRFEEVVNSAKQEILVVTSAGLIKFWKNIVQKESPVERDVATKIMAPITSDNLSVVQEMLKCCSVRHVSPGYLESTIIDGKHLFQTKKESSIDGEKSRDIPDFKNTFYTTDPEYVEKMRNMLLAVWDNARSPSILTLDISTYLPVQRFLPVSDEEYSFSKSDSPYRKMTTFVEEKPGTMNTKILDGIINATKYPAKNWPRDILREYGSGASAVIHPPQHFNLPDMLVFVRNYNKQSSFGQEEFLLVYTSTSDVYLPAAFVTDNPRRLDVKNAFYKGTAIHNNIQLVKRDQLQVRVHGNTVFAGWSVPIPIHSGPYVLPPSCILFEGYGKLKTGELTFKIPSGEKRTLEYNGYDAFVTLFHPASKYAGPGTTGTISRDLITTTYPPAAVQ